MFTTNPTPDTTADAFQAGQQQGLILGAAAVGVTVAMYHLAKPKLADWAARFRKDTNN